MLSPRKLLENARNRIAKRENWQTGTLASDALGVVVAPTDPSACKWCALGALAAEAGSIEDPYGDKDGFDALPVNYREAVTALAMEADPDAVIGGTRTPAGIVFSTNDGIVYSPTSSSGGHERILDLFDRALANMRGE